MARFCLTLPHHNLTLKTVHSKLHGMQSFSDDKQILTQQYVYKLGEIVGASQFDCKGSHYVLKSIKLIYRMGILVHHVWFSCSFTMKLSWPLGMSAWGASLNRQFPVGCGWPTIAPRQITWVAHLLTTPQSWSFMSILQLALLKEKKK